MNMIDKFLSVTALSLTLSISGIAQTKPTSKPVTTPAVSVSSHLVVYEQARLLGDVGTAINSLNYLISSEPSKYASYADTLAAVYLNAGYYNQCNILSSILLSRNPNKESLMAMKAASLRKLNAPVESSEFYSKLYSMTNNYLYGIELLQIQLELQRLPECLATSNTLLSKTTFKEENKINVPKSDNKSFETIPARSFILYIQGLAFNLAKEKGKAKESIEKALAEASQFSLATDALSALSKETEAATSKKE